MERILFVLAAVYIGKLLSNFLDFLVVASRQVNEASIQ